MNHLFLLLHTAFFCYLIAKLPFFQKTEIRTIYLILIFLGKIILGLAYNYIHSEVLFGGDPWLRANDAMLLLEAFTEHPKAVLKFLLLPEQYWDYYTLQPYLTQFAKPDSFYNEVPLVRLYFIGLFCTGGYFNGVIPVFAFVLLIINLKYFSLFSRQLPEIDKRCLILVICFFPSATFFTSGLYKDGLMYIALGLIILNLWEFLNTKKGLLNLFWIIFGLWLMLLFRWGDLLIYLPILFVFIIINSIPKYTFIKYVGILLGLLVIGLIADFFVERVDIMNILYARKTITKGGIVGSSFDSLDWRNSGLGLILYLPRAFIDGLFRPFWGDVGSALQLVTFLESAALMLFCLLCILFKKDKLKMTPLLGFLLFATLSRLCFNGLFIENTGTMVRHRSEIIMYFVVFMMGYFLDFKKLRQYFSFFELNSMLPSLFYPKSTLNNKP